MLMNWLRHCMFHHHWTTRCHISLQRMRTERDSLKETIEELHCVQAQEGQLTSSKRTSKRLHWTVCSQTLVSGQSLNLQSIFLRSLSIGQQQWIRFTGCWNHHPRDEVVMGLFHFNRLDIKVVTNEFLSSDLHLLMSLLDRVIYF